MKSGLYQKFNKVDLTPYNSMRLKSIADMFVVPINQDGLIDAVRDFARKKTILIGNGTNIIFSQERYRSEYVFICTNLINNIYCHDNRIIASCGTKLSELANFALSKSCIGFEFLEDIPGTVGGAVAMNAGADSHSINELIRKVTYFDTVNNEVKQIDDLDQIFDHRSSFFRKKRLTIIETSFECKKGRDKNIMRKIFNYKKKRFSRQPREFPSSGCMFRGVKVNGQKTQSRQVTEIIKTLKLQGEKIGGAMISEKHPNFIVNIGGATGSDCLKLVRLCQDRAKKELGINLLCEYVII